MTSSFKRLGQLTTGLTYGHIHSSIDFAQLQRAQRLVVQGVMDQLRNSNSANERALIEAIKPQLDIATKTIEDLHALFFGHEATRQKRQIFLGIALALGLAACQKGYSVAFTTAAALVHELMEARDERRLRALQKHLNTVKLLIIDELGYVPFTAVGSELLFEVFSQRYERGSMLVTSNLPFDEWTTVFGSERLTGALLDRLTHHVHILEMNGDSFRLATSKKAQRRSAQAPNAPVKTSNEGGDEPKQ